MDQSTALLVYKQTILPYFDYCSFLVEGGNAPRIKKLQTLQNRALRVCIRKFGIEHRTDAIHKECEMEKLADRRQTQLALMMYKRAAKNKLEPKEEGRTRCDLKIKFDTYRARLMKHKRGPLARGIQLWDRIKPSIQMAPSAATFKWNFRRTVLDPKLPD